MRMPNSVKWAGFTEKEWAAKLRSGLEWCGTCKNWIEVQKMSDSNPSKCRECYKKVQYKRFVDTRKKGLA